MTIDIAHHPDGGYWISHDRVNAFISTKAGGIAEVGFHGLQPVSRNSRILVNPDGVLAVRLLTSKEMLFPFDTIQWTPGCIQSTVCDHDDTFTLRFQASERSIGIIVTGPQGSRAHITIRFALASLFTDVHGVRTWSEPELINQRLHLECRDQILLHDWIRRKGPYAGDFLIPEPIRRKIFSRHCRSGLATVDDLRSEYRNADITLYDARSWLMLGGNEFAAARDGGEVVFTAVLPGGKQNQVMFSIQCAENPDLLDTLKTKGHPVALVIQAEPAIPPPVLKWEGHPQVERFFRTVPDIVRSCVVRDIGMLRATPGAYYWIWAWDTMVTALEMLRWGDTETAGSIIRFINSHRDINGAIPGRWTRTYQPLDTPPAGALEFLLLHLATNAFYETGDDRDLLEVYPNAARHLSDISDLCDDSGLMENIGFYPDLPLKFGRTEKSAVAMEIGGLYAFCRLLEGAARKSRDTATAATAQDLAARVHRAFGPVFWDDEKCFLRDSIDLASRKVNDTFPLFSLLFLQTPLGFTLIRPFIASMARFAKSQFQSPHGTTLLPPWDPRRKNEDALSSWYPHWDVYLLKLFRQAREREGIMTWLHAMERVLDRLGYAPEFLALDGFDPESIDAWRRHGAYSNLNCATGWYRAIIEGIFGVEFDPGGMTVVPLDLPLAPIAVHGLMHRGSSWSMRVENAGGSSPVIRVDGEELKGCTKIPSRFHDARPHRLDVTYSANPALPQFTELVNAEVLECTGNADGCRVRVQAMGTVDIVFPLVESLSLAVDGASMPFSTDINPRVGYTQLPIYGNHILSLMIKRSS